ncbi:hypothetical protein [Acinetobacter pittii]|uniref:hypothetical protein n=1 Tax=Acinetobacter pittii TaxID=48296 RepID=UPI002DB8F0F6|nr:hypothetical protein [Acinetobacter pittii]MEB7642941.1 hypothetical protein [Acinetobacter pittii]
MSLKKLLLLPISLVFSAAGCAGIGPNATYYMGTTSFHYDPSYNAYMVKLNGHEIGGGFGGGMNTSPVKFGPQVITWEESNSDKLHRAKNQVTLTKEDLKGVKYLAVHLYPDDTVEVTTSNNWPNPTEKGLKWQERIRKNGAE